MSKQTILSDRSRPHGFRWWHGWILSFALGVAAGYAITISSYLAAWATVILGFIVGVASALVSAPRSTAGGIVGISATFVTAISVATFRNLRNYGTPVFSDMPWLALIFSFVAVPGALGILMVVRNAKR